MSSVDIPNIANSRSVIKFSISVTTDTSIAQWENMSRDIRLLHKNNGFVGFLQLKVLYKRTVLCQLRFTQKILEGCSMTVFEFFSHLNLDYKSEHDHIACNILSTNQVQIL